MLLHTLFIAAIAAVQAETPLVVGYYADWTSSRLPPTQIPFNKLTHLNYAFAVNDANGTFTLPTASLLKQVVDLARPHRTKVLLSVGGWTGSRYLSTLMASPEKRAYMISQFLNLVQSHQLDGIDLDWEFPGRQGMVCNVVDVAHDTEHLLTFLKEYKAAARATLSKKTELTMAVRITPFDKNGAPMRDVSALAKYADRINIMTYDINGAWSTTSGANAPMVAQDMANSVVGSVQAWYKAKWPLSKMTVGVPFYGRAVTTKQTMTATTAFGAPIDSTIPKGDGDDAPWAEPCPGAPSTFSGIWKYGKLKEGPLKDAAWIKGRDDKSKTPWMYHASTRTFVSYDDPRSITTKTKWAICQQKVAGMMIWDLSQDYHNELMTALHKALAC